MCRTHLLGTPQYFYVFVNIRGITTRKVEPDRPSFNTKLDRARRYTKLDRARKYTKLEGLKCIQSWTWSKSTRRQSGWDYMASNIPG